MSRQLPTPSARSGRVLRLLTLLTFLAAGLLAVRFLLPNDERGREEPRTEQGEFTVGDAIALAPETAVVRGYVFSGPGHRELRLCHAREGGTPPRCLGPFLSLYGINEGAFALRAGDTEEGRVLFSPEPVAVSGGLSGTALDVRLVLD